MRGLILLIALFTACQVMAGEVVLEDFPIPKSAYNWIPGGEFPGAQAEFNWDASGYQSAGSVRVDYDYTQGGMYCQWAYDGWLPSNMDAFCVWVKGKPGQSVLMRLVDDTNQYLQIRMQLNTDDWEPFRVVLKDTPMEHWQGANDGIAYLPLKQILVGPEKSEIITGTLWIDRLSIETDCSEDEIMTQRLQYFMQTAMPYFESDAPGLLFAPEDAHTLTLCINDVPDFLAQVTVALTCTNVFGNPLSCLPENVELTRQQDFKVQLNFEQIPGYCQVDARVIANVDGEQIQSENYTYGLGLIPGHHVADKEPDSPFGVGTHFNQWWDRPMAQIIKRVGIAWIRDGEPSMNDNAFIAAQEYSLCYLPVFTWYRTPLEQNRTADGGWDFSDVAQWHAEYAAKYGAELEAYDLVNEPHSPWSAAIGGDWQGGPWQDVFVQYGRQVTEAIRQADPGAKVLWEDIDQLLWYTRFEELGAGDCIGAISPHPYNMHRSNPLPENQTMLGQLTDFWQFTKERGLDWEIWSGEVGYPTFEVSEKTPSHYYAPYTELEQANSLVRMMLCQLSGGVSKIFWYDFYDDGTEPANPEHNFGLLRNNRTAKPALVAYANLIARLQNIQWLGRRQATENFDAVAYTELETGRPVLVAWVREGSNKLVINVSNDANELVITDIFGNKQSVSIQNHEAILNLTPTPVFIDGLSLEDALGMIK